MPDETKPDNLFNQDVQVAEKKETSEVIPPNAPGAAQTATALGDIFSKIESGKAEGKSTKEVVAGIADDKRPAPEDKVEAKKPDVKPEPDKEKKEVAAAPKETEDEGSRESLRKDPVKTEPKPEPRQQEDEVPDEELAVLPHDKPKTAKRIQALLKKIDVLTGETANTKKEAAEKATKLAELEKKLGEVKTVDPETEKKVQAQLDELTMLRRRYDLDNDPEVKNRFESRISQSEDAIKNILTKKNAGKALLDTIAEEGGWSKFASSSRSISISDGEGGYTSVTAAEVADKILAALPLGERKAIEAAMVDQVQATRERERFYKDEQSKAAQYFKEREEKEKKAQEEGKAQYDAARKQIDEYVEKTSREDWLADKPVKEGATEQEKAEVEEHNKYNKQLRSILKKAVGTKDLNGLLEIITDSVRYFDERRKVSSLNSQIEKLRAELKSANTQIEKIKGAGRTVPKSGSIATPPAPQGGETREVPNSLEETLNRMERGERFNSRGQVVTIDD